MIKLRDVGVAAGILAGLGLIGATAMVLMQNKPPTAAAVVDAVVPPPLAAVVKVVTPVQQAAWDSLLDRPEFIKWSNPKVIETKYDKFDDQMDFHIPDTMAIQTYEPVELRAFASTSGNGARHSFTLHFIRSAQDWKLLHYHEVIFLVDGEHWDMKQRLGTEVIGGHVLEQLFVKFTAAQFTKMVCAKKVEARLGTIECVLEQTTRNYLGGLAYAVLVKGGSDAGRPAVLTTQLH